MKVIKTDIEDLYIIEPHIFGDERGYFFESFSERDFARLTGKKVHFVQDNESKSARGVLRGLHFQRAPHAQGKLVRVVSGAAIDVAVDIRHESPTFGKYHYTLLSGINKRMFYLPEGFAHGFLSLEDHTIFQYKCTDFYTPEAEGSILWNDPDIAIPWEELIRSHGPEMTPSSLILSPKDGMAPLLKEAAL